jgi:transcriptional regulator with XRE-family HTH domain
MGVALPHVPDAVAHPVRIARVARGLTQRQLEALAGLPWTTLSRVENRTRQLEPAEQLRVAMALAVNVAELFDDAYSPVKSR